MTGPEVVRSNARLNALSNLVMNPGGALVAADAYRVFVEGIADLTTGLWTLVATGLISTGIKLLSLLEADL